MMMYIAVINNRKDPLRALVVSIARKEEKRKRGKEVRRRFAYPVRSMGSKCSLSSIPRSNIKA